MKQDRRRDWRCGAGDLLGGSPGCIIAVPRAQDPCSYLPWRDLVPLAHASLLLRVSHFSCRRAAVFECPAEGPVPMSLQIAVAHTGQRLDADPVAFSSVDALKHWISQACDIPPESQVLLTPGGKHVKLQALLTEVGTLLLCL